MTYPKSLLKNWRKDQNKENFAVVVIVLSLTVHFPHE